MQGEDILDTYSGKVVVGGGILADKCTIGCKGRQPQYIHDKSCLKETDLAAP